MDFFFLSSVFHTMFIIQLRKITYYLDKPFGLLQILFAGVNILLLPMCEQFFSFVFDAAFKKEIRNVKKIEVLIAHLLVKSTLSQIPTTSSIFGLLSYYINDRTVFDYLPIVEIVAISPYESRLLQTSENWNEFKYIGKLELKIGILSMFSMQIMT